MRNVIILLLICLCSSSMFCNYQLVKNYEYFTVELCILYGNYTKLYEMAHKQIKVVHTQLVTVTTYNSTKKQTDSTPFITASNTKVKYGIVAVSPDLISKGYSFGSKIQLDGLGIYTVEDLMNKRYTNRVDVWLPHGAPSFKKEKVRIALLESNVILD